MSTAPLALTKPSYASVAHCSHPPRPPSLSPVSPRLPPSPAGPLPPAPSPALYRPPVRRTESASQPDSPSYSPERPYRPPSPLTPREGSGVSRLAPVLEIFGDSFAGVFSLLGNSARIHKTKGASARGLGNPNSTLHVGPEILHGIETSRAPSLLLMYGQVDLVNNYVWQLKSKGERALGPEDWVEGVVDQYTAFLASSVVPLAEEYGRTVYVAGVMPAVVDDDYLELSSQKYLEKQGVETALPPLSDAYHSSDLSTRAKMAQSLNTQLSSFCASHPCLHFVDISPSIVDPADPRRVAPQYRDALDPTNIHILWETTIDFWCRLVPPLHPFLPSQPGDVDRLRQSLETWTTEKRERMAGHHLTRGLLAV